jgi:multidrug efflux system membrane fusion protein
VVVLPRSALRDGDQVYVVDEENRLRFREVEVLRRRRDAVVIAGGLAPGERVAVSSLVTPVDGMEVRVIEEEDSP